MIRWFVRSLLPFFFLPAGAVFAETPEIGSPEAETPAVIPQAVPQATSRTAPAVASVLPADVAGVLLVNNQPEALRSLSRFLSLEEEKAAVEVLPYLSRNVRAAEEVAPWLGDWAAIAVLPPAESEPEAELFDRTLTIAPLVKPQNFQAFLDRVRSDREAPPERQEYGGVTLLVWAATEVPTADRLPSIWVPEILGKTWKIFTQLPPVPAPKILPADTEFLTPPTKLQPGLAIAVLPDYLVVATDTQPIERWIDSRRAEAKLADNPRFQEILRNPKFARSLFAGYGDFDAIARLPLPEISLPFLALVTDIAPVRQAVAALTAPYRDGELFVWLTEEGARGEAKLHRHPVPEGIGDTLPQENRFAPETSPAATAPSEPLQIARHVPGLTYLGAVGTSPAEHWPSLAAAWQKRSPSASLLASLRQIARLATDLDLDADVVPLLDGEAAIFAFATDGGLLPALHDRLHLGAGAALQTSDRPGLSAILQRLDRFAAIASGGAISVESTPGGTADGREIVRWILKTKEGKAIDLFAYSWLDDETLLLASGSEALVDAVTTPADSLQNAFVLREAIAPLPDSDRGYFFADASLLLSLTYGLLPPHIDTLLQEAGSKEVLGQIQSFSATVSPAEAFDRLQFVLRLEPKQ